MPDALYRRVLGAAFETLPAQVRAVHGSSGGSVSIGVSDVERGRNPFSWLAGVLLGAPAPGVDIPLRVEIIPAGNAEEWVRHFGDHVMRSRMWDEQGVLLERMGPVTLQHELVIEGEVLHLRPRRCWFLGVPLPRFLHPTVVARTNVVEGHYGFEVSASLPLIGLVVSYHGVLAPAGAQA